MSRCDTAARHAHAGLNLKSFADMVEGSRSEASRLQRGIDVQSINVATIS